MTHLAWAWRKASLCLFVAALLVGCKQTPAFAPASAPTATTGSATTIPTRIPSAVPSPTASSSTTWFPLQSSAPTTREIVILHTNDEHGALLPSEDKDFTMGGAAFASASWGKLGYSPTVSLSNVLLLSGGDNATGPAISTWFRGESTIEVMNAMGYRASVIGNHEFDFGQDGLRQRVQQAKFPYLAANLYRAGTLDVVDWVKPYVIVETNGIKVGIIGLSLEETPQETAAKNLDGLAFGPYEPALRRWVPVARSEGAQIILVESHICPDKLIVLADNVRDLGITLFEGAHCHQAHTSSAGGAIVGAASAYWKDYVLTKVTFDTQVGKVVGSEQKVVDVVFSKTASTRPDASVTHIIEKWNERVRLALGEVIGYTQTGIETNSEQMANLLLESWLWAYEKADVVLSNTGGFRQSIPSGEVTLSSIVSVFPFENELYELEVKGKDITHALKTLGGQIVYAGVMRDDKGALILTKDKLPLEPDMTYRLLTTDYMYANPKYPFRLYDGQPYETSISWRQPVIDWIRVQHSTPDNPLEEHIAGQSEGK